MIIWRLITTVVVAAILGAAGYALYRHFRQNEATNSVEEGKISSLKAVAQLCTLDIYREVSVLDTINNKVIFGFQKQQGSISFDLDSLDIDTTGDTVRVILPPETVELQESTDPGSWEVIDTKALSLFTADRLTNLEDNLIKQRLRRRAIRQLYADSTVARARSEACRNISVLLGKAWRRPVKVTDPIPMGAGPE